MYNSFNSNVKQNVHTASVRSDCFEFLFGFSFVIFQPFSHSATNLSIDYGMVYELVYDFKDLR